MLDNWRKESRIRGTIPKPQFPMLKRLMNALAPNIKKICRAPLKLRVFTLLIPKLILKKLPTDRSEETRRVLDNSLLEFLKETRVYNSERLRHKRGKSHAKTRNTDSRKY